MRAVDGRLNINPNDAARSVLRGIMLHYGPKPFTQKEIAVRMGIGMCAADVRLALRQLQLEGEIVAFRKSWGEIVCALPFERCLELAAEFIDPQTAEDARSAEAEPDGKAAGKDIALDLLAVLDDIERREVKITRKGHFDKKRMERWARLAGLGEKEAASVMPSPLPYPANAAMLLDLALRTGTAVLARGFVRTDNVRIARLVEKSAAECRRALYPDWLRVWCPDDAELRLFAFLLPHLPGNEWFGADSMLRRFGQTGAAGGGQAKRGEGEPARTERLTRWLDACSHCGWLETGVSREGGIVFRSLLNAATDEAGGGRDEGCEIQSDLEVIVPPDASYETHRLLLAIGEWTGRHHVTVYRIGKSRAEAAWRHGWTSGRLIAELQRRSRGGVPETVRRELAEWERQADGIRLEHAVTLRFRDKTLADEIASLPGMQALSGENSRLPDGSIVVAANRAEALRELLGKYGFAAQTPAAAGPPDAKRDGAAQSRTASSSSADAAEVETEGLFREKFATDMYRRVERVPDVRELFPGLDRIPAAWLETCRKYHPSTALDIVRRAIEWQCCVKVRTAGGDHLVAPSELPADAAAGGGFHGIEQETGLPLEIDLAETAGIQLVLSATDQVIKSLSNSC